MVLTLLSLLRCSVLPRLGVDDDVVDILPTPAVVVKLTAAGEVSTVKMVGGASLHVNNSRSAVGGASAIRNTAGSPVLARPRLLISIPPAVAVVAVVVDNDDDDDVDRRGDVTVTSRPTSALFRDVIDTAVAM